MIAAEAEGEDPLDENELLALCSPQPARRPR